MNSNNLQLDRNARPVRRIGLSRNGRLSASLLSTFNVPRNDPGALDNMPAKATNPRTRQLGGRRGTLKQEEAKNVVAKAEEEDINAPPICFSGGDSSSEDEKRSRSVDIKPSTFRSAKDTPTPQVFNGRRKNEPKSSIDAIVNTRSTRNKTTSRPSSSGGSKRKTEDGSPPSSSTKDVFGTLVTSAKRTKRIYVSKRSKKPASFQAKGLKISQEGQESSPREMKSFDVPGTPKKTEWPGKKFSVPGAEGLDSPDVLPARSKRASTSLSPPSKLGGVRTVIFDSDDEIEEPSFAGIDGLDSPAPGSDPRAEKDSPISKNLLQATQAQEFKRYSLDDSDLFSHVKSVLSNDTDDELGLVWDPQPEDYHLNQTQIPSVCPMCKAPVDPQELLSRGRMNTRAQERFCQSHQRKTAEEDWRQRGYPEIDWQTFPLRLSMYLKNMEKLIKGEDSHYRRLYSSRMAAGQDRTLRKTTANLIPGYYGSRGLQAISEYIMQNNTSLLKKVAPKDRLISKRSVTAYVQAVLVPEITTLLIMEDMSVDEEKARKILDDSAAMGELLQEEIKDVYVSRVGDSEDEESDEDELA